MTDTLKLYTSVPASLLRSKLLNGSVISIAGITLLATAGSMIPAEVLSYWGLPILLLAVTLVTWGLLPYRRLSHTQTHPHSLEICSDGTICYQGQRKRPILTLPFGAIAELKYVDKEAGYGIGVKLKEPCPSPVVIHDPPIDLKAHRKNAQAVCRCDLFFPLFDRSSYQELQECLEAEIP